MALLDFLKSTPLPLPESRTTSASESRGVSGSVTPSFKRGELILKNRAGQAFRLKWTGEETEEQRALTLPKGEYALLTYRIVREQDGEVWHISATRPSMAKYKVQTGHTTHVEVEDTIKMDSFFRGGRAGMMIKGDHEAGLSIYRQEKRIPIGYRILSDSGDVVTSGNMRYG